MQKGLCVLVIAVVSVCSAQFNFNRFFGFNQRRPNFRQQQNFRPQQQQQNQRGLYFSWEDPRYGRNAKFSWAQANSLCQSRGQQLVSLQSGAKNSAIVNKIARDRIPYIWTSGTLRGGNFFWATGQPVQPINWSRTGGANRAQPDNREGDENCLAVLNNFYPNDGITWHDVSCHHTKPFICE